MPGDHPVGAGGVNDRVLPLVTLLLGIAVVVRTLVAGGGATSIGLLFGVLLAVAGGLRMWAERRRRAL
jgi:hypothetical protein